jgi:outer membrane protein OmpA-like peptidoglycan-associated protein
MRLTRCRDKRIQFSAVLGLAFCVSGTAVAQSPTLLTDTSSECDIFKAISRAIPAECQDGYKADEPLTRSLVRKNQKTAPPPPVIQETPSNGFVAAMTVQFAYDSAELTGQAKAVLDKLANVFNNELMYDIPFAIEGHADQQGSPEYNHQLSIKRAAAVRDYLVGMQGVDPNRFEVSGYGSARLLDADNPYSAINRRVEFRNLGG